MITTVTGKHQVTIPAKLASALGIVPGSRLEWQAGGKPAEVRVRVLPDRRTIANTLLGAGRRYRGLAATTTGLNRPAV
jgi:AbrB family looped-hinge helix DNA binding protein